MRVLDVTLSSARPPRLEPIRLPLGTRQPFKRLKQMLTERNYCTKVSDRNRDFLR